MKVLGIVAEYNPFHNGHAYQIRRAKELSGADYVIVIMSGNFVQRGAPAVTDKFTRTAMALANGADLVLELPVLWATASAEGFAGGSMALMDHLGIVDVISFGCETTDTFLLTSAAKLLAKEPEDYRKLLAVFLRQGMSYPLARAQALIRCLPQKTDLQTDTAPEDLAAILSSPNNILALEYQKALLRRNSEIELLPILRQGSGYHEDKLSECCSSATALRKLLRQQQIKSCRQTAELLPHVPQQTAEFLTSPDTILLWEEDFSDMLYYKLLSERDSGFASYADSSDFLSNKISRALDSYLDYASFCMQLKTRDLTYTRISRLLLHILLNIHKTDYATAKSLDFIPYLRPLGFRKNASELLSRIQKNCDLPLLMKPAKAADILSPQALSVYRKDLFASNLYYGAAAQKSRIVQKKEQQRELILLP